jgi:hypothetical protein
LPLSFDKPRWMIRNTAAGAIGSEFLYNANRSRVIQLMVDQKTSQRGQAADIDIDRGGEDGRLGAWPASSAWNSPGRSTM